MSEENFTKLAIKYLEQSVKYQEKLHEVIELRQQIRYAENVIRELSFGELSDCIGNRKEVAETYWSKYGK